MMARSNGHYGNGYGQAARNHPNLPARIKCMVCSRTKGPDSYSAKQLDTLLEKMRGTKGFDASKIPVITCTMETSRQVVELECFVCDTWMGLDKFTKAQRKKPDNAECMKCVQERLEMEPHEVGRDDEDGEHDGSDQGGPRYSDEDDVDDQLIDGATGNMSNMSVTNGPSTYPSQVGGSSTRRGGGGVTLTGSTVPTSRPTTVSNAGTAPTVRTSGSKFNPNAYGGSTKSTAGAWAKIPAVPRKPIKKADSSDDDDQQIFDDDSD